MSTFFEGSMSNLYCQKLVAGALLASAMAVSHAQDVGTRWLLNVEDLKHVTKVKATIRFSSETAGESCMAGGWRRIIVEAKTAQDEAFFPLAEPLAYQVIGGELTLGRTTICDGYLFLSAKSDATDIQGQFNSVSIMGIHKLGSFTLNRIR